MQCPSCRAEFSVAGATNCPECGHSFVDAFYRRVILRPGVRLNERLYTIEEKIGLGAWSIVYSARNNKDGSQVAIKEYYPPGCEREDGKVSSQGAVAAWEFKRGLAQMATEAELMSRFTHRNLLRCFDFFHDNGTAYLVTEVLSGETLQQRMTREGGRISEAEVLPILEQLLTALDSLNRSKVAHADIKPENILVTPEGRVVLIDFGAAVDYAAGAKAEDATPAYAAPEQLEGACFAGPRTDLFALCATIYHVLTGVLPTPARERLSGGRLREPPARLISPPLMESLRRGLQLDPERRPSVAQMRQGIFAASAPKLQIRPLAQLVGHEGGLVNLDFSPDSNFLISGDERGSVFLWQLPEIQRGNLHPMKLFVHRGLTQVRFSPDGKLVASCSRQGSLKMWAPPSGRELPRPLIADAEPIVNFAFSPNGTDMAVGYADGRVELWRQPGRVVATFEGHTSALTCLLFSPDGTKLATASRDKTTKLWDLGTGELMHYLEGHKGIVQAMSFSHDSRVLATGSQDRTSRLWDVEMGQEMAVIMGQSGAIIGVHFVPYTGGILTGSGDGKLRLYSINPTTQVATFDRQAIVRFLVCAPEGGIFATANGDRSIQLWGLQA